MQKIKISDVGYEPKYYPRVNAQEDWFTVNVYKDALVADPRRSDSKRYPHIAFPPIHVVRATPKTFRKNPYKYMVIDGLHRLRAFYAAGRTEIYAEVESLPESKWFARSVELNVASKRAFDTGDKAFIAKRLQEDGWEIKDVASLLLMRVESLEKIFISRCQKLRVTELVKAGREHRGNRKVNGAHYGFLKAPYAEAGISGTSKGLEALTYQGSTTSTDVLQILDSFLGVLETGILDLSNEEVKARVERIAELVSELALV